MEDGGAESIPPAETEEEEDDEEDDEPLERRVSRKRCDTQLDEGASSRLPGSGVESSSAEPLAVPLLRAVPPAPKKKSMPLPGL